MRNTDHFLMLNALDGKDPPHWCQQLEAPYPSALNLFWASQFPPGLWISYYSFMSCRILGPLRLPHAKNPSKRTPEPLFPSSVDPLLSAVLQLNICGAES
jgi:hypothetical protein